MIRGIHLSEAVAEDLLRRLSAIGDRRRQLARQQRKRLGIVVRRGEIQIEQLQRRFELCRRRAAGNAVFRKADVRGGRREFAGEHPLQVERLEAAHTRQAHVGGRKRRLGQVRTRRQRGPARRFHVEENLIVLEVGGFQPGLDAIRKSHDRDADSGNLPARADRRRRRFGLDELASHGRFVPRRHGGSDRPTPASPEDRIPTGR